MNNLDTIIVILFTIPLILIVVMLIFIALLLGRINRSIEDFLRESRENTNAKNTSLDRNFADIVKEIKKVTYQLDAVYQKLRDKDLSSKGR